jgi:hypothetical protein
MTIHFESKMALNALTATPIKSANHQYAIQYD